MLTDEDLYEPLALALEHEGRVEMAPIGQLVCDALSEWDGTDESSLLLISRLLATREDLLESAGLLERLPAQTLN